MSCVDQILAQQRENPSARSRKCGSVCESDSHCMGSRRARRIAEVADGTLGKRKESITPCKGQLLDWMTLDCIHRRAMSIQEINIEMTRVPRTHTMAYLGGGSLAQSDSDDRPLLAPH